MDNNNPNIYVNVNMNNSYNNAPFGNLPTDYAVDATYVILTILTCGIYRIYKYAKLVDNMNTIVARQPGSKQGMNYWIVWIISLFTCGFFLYGYNHSFFNLVGSEARRRGISTDVSAGTFWLWGFLGSAIIVGPFIADKKLFDAANAVNADFNARG